MTGDDRTPQEPVSQSFQPKMRVVLPGEEINELRAQCAALQAQVERLTTAITPKHAKDWPVEHIATLAEAHRWDSETVDSTELSYPHGNEYDYDAVRLKNAAALTEATRRQEALGIIAREMRSELTKWLVDWPEAVKSWSAHLDAALLAGPPAPEMTPSRRNPARR